jgi:dTDP-4-dehydrorhamnose 3,5-epimerase
MNEASILPTKLAGVFIIERPVFSDDRGFFRETFRRDELEASLGFGFNPQQANHSRSTKDTLRGIHIAPWHKLVTCINGLVQQIVVDTRKDSATFGQYISVLMGEENFRSVFVPAGLGNGFLVLSDQADYSYLTTENWAPNKELNLAWNDPDVNITWQSSSPNLSDKDKSNPTLKELYV